MLRIVVPGAPQGKGRPRFVRKTGRVYTPAQTESYEAKLAYFAREAMTAAGLEMYPRRAALRCRVVALFEVPASWSSKKQEAALRHEVRPTARIDVDNIFKVIGDGLNGVVWADDTSIVTAFAAKVYSLKPGLVIEVEPVRASEFQPEVAEPA